MKTKIYTALKAAGIILCCTIFISACKKDDTETNNSTPAKAYFSNNVINRDLIIPYAKDNSTDITSNFSFYTFRITDTASTAGIIEARNDAFTVKGTWSIDAGYNKISFVLPANVVTDFAFINKEWQFANRESAIVKLVATNGEADELHFVKK